MIKITANLNESITDSNLIYCSTFQLAWNELSSFLKGQITFEQQNELVNFLNKLSFKKEHLNKKCYLAFADHVGKGIIEKIKSELMTKFNETSKANLDPKNFQPSDIIAYAFLLKILRFNEKFEEIENFHFNNIAVKAFGIKKAGESTEKLQTQVEILRYVNDDDFVISLKTKSDVMVLAKIEPRASLAKTIHFVENSIVPCEQMREKECLKIPKIAFDLEHHFEELAGQRILVNNKPSGDIISDAVQFIKFELNEEGAKLRSEAAIMTFRCCTSFQETKPRQFVFAKPFLLYLKEKDTSPPYFATWIADTELLKREE